MIATSVTHERRSNEDICCFGCSLKTDLTKQEEASDTEVVNIILERNFVETAALK